ncbi:Spy/CpxP family protein refolding chaperone [Alteromonas facilis]|uniref:Spy/CpxP family protein refolding chaperone n=1 Tax=Alteromonas facilis TaxID=2048004 RepID=UPI000C292765|nr:Spy/CpxP family protein refolding chaperone [Alteromonas facilis]
MKRYIPVVITLCALSLSAGSYAHEKGKRGTPLLKELKQLSLTAEQREEVKLILESARTSRGDFKEARREARDTMSAIVQSESWDADAAQQAFLEHADSRKEAMLNRATLMHDVWQLLDSEQQQTLSQRMADKSGERGERGGDREKKWDKLSHKLALTDEQMSAIKSIETTFKSKQTAFRAQMQSLKQTERDIIQQSVFDLAAWESLYAEFEPVAMEQAVEHAYMRHQIFNQLTEEQQQRLSRLMRKGPRHS